MGICASIQKTNVESVDRFEYISLAGSAFPGITTIINVALTGKGQL